MLPELSYSALETLRVPELVRGLRDAAPILCYHNVVPATHPAELGDPSLHLPLDRFEEQVDWLAQEYSIVPLDELVSRVIESRPLKGLAALTFDDAYLGVFENAWPMLKLRGIPATVFVVAGAAERPEPFWWDWPDTAHAADAERTHWLKDLHGDALAVHAKGAERPALPSYMLPAPWFRISQAAKEGMGIGAHSMTHRALSTLTEREIQFETYPCRGVISQRVGFRPSVFAYPYGLFDDRVLSAVRAAGYSAAVSLDAGLNDGGTDRWALRRINVPASLTTQRFEAWTAGLMPHRRIA